MEQRDLGMKIYNSLKVEAQVDRMTKKAFGMLAEHCVEELGCRGTTVQVIGETKLGVLCVVRVTQLLDGFY